MLIRTKAVTTSAVVRVTRPRLGVEIFSSLRNFSVSWVSDLLGLVLFTAPG